MVQAGFVKMKWTRMSIYVVQLVTFTIKYLGAVRRGDLSYNQGNIARLQRSTSGWTTIISIQTSNRYIDGMLTASAPHDNVSVYQCNGFDKIHIKLVFFILGYI